MWVEIKAENLAFVKNGQQLWVCKTCFDRSSIIFSVRGNIPTHFKVHSWASEKRRNRTYHIFPFNIATLWVIFWELLLTLESSCFPASCPKANSGIIWKAVIFIVAKDVDSCSGTWVLTTNCIESFFVTAGLQGILWANQRLPVVNIPPSEVAR